VWQKTVDKQNVERKVETKCMGRNGTKNRTTSSSPLCHFKVGGTISSDTSKTFPRPWNT